MGYLVIKDNTTIFICELIEELIDYLKISISDTGVVTFAENNILTVSYDMKQFTKDEVLKHLTRYYLKQIECTLKIGIYKLYRI